ncbi:MAG: bifunctional DNA primase/polymerase, partial [Promicromonosporaceae bacterium]|nr:bifunctional DNA primase/polymerase [Promicromonosporaceae bacterium]
MFQPDQQTPSVQVLGGHLLETALQLHDAGYTILPVKAGSKAPAVKWRDFENSQPTRQQTETWFARPDTQGIGIVTGGPKRIEMFEIEGRARDRIPELTELANDSGLGELWARMNTGWLETTPTGGLHWHALLDHDVPPNQKLATRHNNTGSVEVLAETRGQGGFTIIAPTPGNCHPTGKPWTRLTGGPNTIPTLTAEEREAFTTLLATLNETPEPDQPHLEMIHGNPDDDGSLRPGDDYNQQAQWADILHDWTRLFTRAGTTYWRRPGKTEGISATTNSQGTDTLKVFTTSTEFDTDGTYTKFAAHTILSHHGDYQEAARQLRTQGYGKPARALTVITGGRNLHPEFQAPHIDGANALKPHPAHHTATITLTDHGNAELLVLEHGHQIRYVATRGKWLTWNGHHWQWDDKGLIVEHAKHAISGLPDSLRKHRDRSLSRRGIEAAVALARTHPDIALTHKDLDRNPLALNTPKGPVDLTTGEVRPPNPDDHHTRTTLLAPDFGQPTHKWDQFLTETFQGDQNVIRFMRRLAGYSATGLTTKHILPFLLGPGGNGKGVLTDV